MVRLRLILALGLALGAPTGAAAQANDAGALQDAARPPILTLDQEALYDRSKFGQALRARVAAAVAEIEAQSRAFDAQLEAEERALTVQRAGMDPQEFAPLAAAFDAKVSKLRAENAAAADAVRAMEQAGRQEFIAAAAQVIGDYMVERGAAAIIDKGAVIVSLLGLDVTDQVIARINAVLGDGSAASAPAEVAP